MAPENEPPIAERVSKLASDAWAMQTRILRQSVDVGRQAWSPATDPTALGKAWLETMATEGQRYWQELATMGLEVARDVILLNARTSAAVLGSLSEAAGSRQPSADSSSAAAGPSPSTASGAAGAAAAPAGAAPARRPTVVTLTAPTGTMARGSLTVVNRHPRSRRIEVSASALQDAATDAPCSGTIAVDPSRVTVPPGQERRIELSAELDPQVFAPGRAYTGTIQVSGGDEATVDVVVSASQP